MGFTKCHIRLNIYWYTYAYPLSEFLNLSLILLLWYPGFPDPDSVVWSDPDPYFDKAGSGFFRKFGIVLGFCLNIS